MRLLRERGFPQYENHIVKNATDGGKVRDRKLHLHQIASFEQIVIFNFFCKLPFKIDKRFNYLNDSTLARYHLHMGIVLKVISMIL